jgi:transcriptional regulator with XRE-family HTH domain
MRYSQEQRTRFAERLREWRGEHDLNQHQAAERIGVKYRTYQDWERGKVPQPPGLAKLRSADAPTISEDGVGDADALAEFEERVLGELAELRRLLLDRQDSD